MIRRTFDSGLAATMLCAGLILTACGGGGGSGSSASPVSSSGDATTLKAGLYTAEIEYLVEGKPTQAPTTYLSPTGKFAIVFDNDAGVSIGKLSFDGTKISGTSTDYRQLVAGQPNPEGFIEKQGAEKGTINGTIRSQESATFSTSNTAGEVNTNVTLQRINPISDLGISLMRASDTYSSTGKVDVALTVGEDGSLFAQYPQPIGCILEGSETLSVPDASINVFDISYTMSNCTNESRDGEYSGVGIFVPTKNQRMQVAFAAHNGKVAMKFTGTN